MPVDLYVGGAEHAVLHLLYARFWHKVLFDLGLVHTKEPFQKLLNPGMILGYSYRYYDDNLSDDPGRPTRAYPAPRWSFDGGDTAPPGDGGRGAQGALGAGRRRALASTTKPYHPDIEGLVLEVVTEKMSKSRGNVVNPDDVIARWGTDAMRLYEMFMGPIDKGAPWSDDSIPGLYRFLQRARRSSSTRAPNGAPRARPGRGRGQRGAGTPARPARSSRVTERHRGLRFNTAISKLMVFVRDIARDGRCPRSRRGVRPVAVALRPAPGRGAVGARWGTQQPGPGALARARRLEQLVRGARSPWSPR